MIYQFSNELIYSSPFVQIESDLQISLCTPLIETQIINNENSKNCNWEYDLKKSLSTKSAFWKKTTLKYFCLIELDL